MARRTKKTTQKPQTPKTTGNQNNGPYFVITNVEADIRRKHMSTDQLCKKYSKTPEEIQTLISTAYCRSEGKAREIKRILANNDSDYAKRMTAKSRQETGAADQANPAVEAEKTPLELQKDVVEKAKADVDLKRQEWNLAKTNQSKADARVETAKENLAKAKAELTDAEDAAMQAESKVHEAAIALENSCTFYEAENVKLHEMEVPKLLHISALKDGIPSGKIYMSAYDYAKLSDTDKKKVIPVEPEDISLNYPDNFYLYPLELTLEAYQSACQYALAYIQLILETKAGVAIELICNDHMVKSLAEHQEG